MMALASGRLLPASAIAVCAVACWSPSTSSTSRPARLLPRASCTAIVLLPAPPLVLPTVTIIGQCPYNQLHMQGNLFCDRSTDSPRSTSHPENPAVRLSFLAPVTRQN